MSLFWNDVANINRAYCAAHHLPEPPTYGDAHYCMPEDTTVEDTALAWLWECRKSEDAARSVMSGIEITEHGDFVAKAMHLLSNVRPSTDRNKLVNELIDSFEGTLKACAANE